MNRYACSVVQGPIGQQKSRGIFLKRPPIFYFSDACTLSTDFAEKDPQVILRPRWKSEISYIIANLPLVRFILSS
jgi:hypothetical protein